jgi:hypothetical protein
MAITCNLQSSLEICPLDQGIMHHSVVESKGFEGSFGFLPYIEIELMCVHLWDQANIPNAWDPWHNCMVGVVICELNL